jgi:GAF domain-containing protein
LIARFPRVSGALHGSQDVQDRSSPYDRDDRRDGDPRPAESGDVSQTPEVAPADGPATLLDHDLSALPSDRLLDELLSRLCRVMDADVAQFLLVEDAALHVVATYGVPMDRVRELRIPVGSGFAGTVAATASPAIISDTSELEQFGATWIELGVRALVGVPLVVEGRVLGAAVVGSRSGRTFGDHDIGLLTAAADRAAWAVEQGLLIAAQRAARDSAASVGARLARLRLIADELLADLTVEGVVRTVVERGLSLIGAFGGAVWAVDADGTTLHLRGVVGYPEEVEKRWTSMALQDEGPVAEAARTRSTVVIRSLSERDERYPSLAGRASVGQAFVTAPLIVEGRLIGLVGLGFSRADELDSEGIEFIGAASALCAAAMYRALVVEARERSLAQTRESARRLAVLQRLTATLADVRDGPSTLDFIVDQVCAAVGGSHAALCVLDEPAGVMRTVRMRGLDPSLQTTFGEFPYVPGLPATDALLERRPVLLRDVAERDAKYPFLSDRYPLVSAWACLPLAIGDRGIGSLAIGLPAPQAFSDDDLEFLTALADQCGHALERARLLGAEAANRRRLELLAEAGRIFAAPLDVQLTSVQFSRLVVGRAADAVSVHIREFDGRYSVAAAEHVDADQLEAQRRIADALPASIAAAYDRLLQDGAPLLVSGLEIDAFIAAVEDAEVRDALRRRPATSSILLPLVSGGRGLGVLTITTITGGHPPLEDADVEEMVELAGRLALAVDSARLLRQQTEIAHTLQRSLLPSSLPQVPGAEVAVRYLPGAEGVDVGGDFYDVIPLPSGRIGLVVGDVMGRGIRAAAVMGQLRAAVRSYCLEGHPPAALLTRLDRLVGTLEEGMLVTALYAEWDPARSTVLCACAGHLPPLLRLPGEAPRYVELDPGVPLGVGAHAYTEVELTLPPGALLLAFTDGLVEGPDLPVEDGMDRLAAVVADADGALAVCDAALDELRPFDATRRYDDDTALLALVTRPGDSPPTADVPPGDGVSVDLAADNASPGRARAIVTEVLGDWELRPLVDSATLLTSELVTNAVRHAGTGLRLSLTRVGADRVRISVHDRAPNVAVRVRTSTDDAEGGRGLFLVEHLSAGWGSVSGDSGKTVWFELQA